METETLRISGMACEACEGHVTRALLGLDGVQSAQVSLEAGEATVTYDPAHADITQMIGAVEEEGYGATQLTTPRDSR